MRIIGSGRAGGNAGKLFAEAGHEVLSSCEALAVEAGRTREMPLWYYVLNETNVRGAEQCLGLAGGWIAAEVLLVLLDAPGEPGRSGWRTSFSWWGWRERAS